MYGNNLCGGGNASSLAVTISTLPGTAGTISGQSIVCQGSSWVYSVLPISNATGYVWTLPPGASIISGANTFCVTVSFSMTASSGNMKVYGTNSCGNGTVSNSYFITVGSKPPKPVVSQLKNNLTGNNYTLVSSSSEGNQWYLNNDPLAGATGNYIVPQMPGEYFTIVTLGTCSSDTSNRIIVQTTGIDPVSNGVSVNIYPVPNDGRFTAAVTWPSETSFSMIIYNELGVMIYRRNDIRLKAGLAEELIDLRPTPPGIYTLVFTSNAQKVIRRIIIKD